MATAHWQRMRALFEEALAKPPTERDAFLRANCGANEVEIRQEVEALLAEAAEDDTAIRNVISSEAALLVHPSAPTTIGPYRILGELGQGGMGTVYLAERHGEFRLQVALKLATRCQADRTLLARFRAERQILANLHHPNIAQVLDGGNSPDGTPYLVMEYVNGEPITAYCQRLKLPVAERLRLFCKACAAVYFAHQNLVVHRDIKPGNLLVTPQGEPKLLDFGIAKLLDAAAAGVDPVRTEAAARMMTPAYASPEQIRGKAITTASDVYSLGVLLYELLTKTRPFQSTESESYTLQKAICEDEPLRPSALAPGLSRDLDAIVLKAMRKQPADRYASVEHLAADIERHLHCYPVLARNRTWQYNASRFLRRHKAFLPVAAAFALVVSSGLWGLDFQARQTAAQRDRAVAALREAETARQIAERQRTEAERNERIAQDYSTRATSAELLAIEEASRARDEAASSEAAARFLEELFRSADPMTATERNVSAARLLQRGARRVQHELSDQPAIQARLQNAIGRAFLALGDSAAAEPLIQEALATRRRLFGNQHLETARSLLSQSKMLETRGDYSAAHDFMRQAIAVFQSQGVKGETELAAALVDRGILALSRSAYTEARDAFEQSQSLSRKQLPERRRILRDATLALSGYHARKGNHVDAEQTARQSLVLSRQIYGEEHPEVGVDWSAIGIALRDQGRFPEAAAAMDNAIRIYRKVLGEDHPSLGNVLNNRATVAYSLGDYPTAERNFVEALRIRTKVSGPDHLSTMRILNNLGVVRFQQRDFDGAIVIYQDALERQRRVVGEETRDVADTLNNLGRSYGAKQEWELAERHLRQSLAIRRKVQGEDHPLVAVALDGLGILLRDQDRYREAQKLHEESYAIRQARLGADHPAVSVPLLGMGYCQLKLGNPAAAEDLLQRALAIRQAKLPAGHWEIAEVQSVLGASLLRQGRKEDAAVLLRTAHSRLQGTLGDDAQLTRQAVQWLAETGLRQPSSLAASPRQAPPAPPQ
ncbi:MAG: tetratricopeptide repeat protein [Bryobacterales bacterium]|nr:tetratricopeptide repeat protein [Bryobacterales bacterium]